MFPSWPLQGVFLLLFFFLSSSSWAEVSIGSDLLLCPIVSARPGPVHSEHLLRWWGECGTQACVEGTRPLVWAHGGCPSRPTTSSGLPLSRAPDLPPAALSDGGDSVALRVKEPADIAGAPALGSDLGKGGGQLVGRADILARKQRYTKKILMTQIATTVRSLT